MDRVDEQAVEGVMTEPTTASEDIFNETLRRIKEVVC